MRAKANISLITILCSLNCLAADDHIVIARMLSDDLKTVLVLESSREDFLRTKSWNPASDKMNLKLSKLIEMANNYISVPNGYKCDFDGLLLNRGTVDGVWYVVVTFRCTRKESSGNLPIKDGVLNHIIYMLPDGSRITERKEFIKKQE